MWELQKQDLPYERIMTPKTEGLKKYAAMGEHMKCELIEEKADDIFSEYTLGPHFIDFCRGPHVPSTIAHQGVQAALRRGRVLEGRREEPPDAAHLRHGVLHARRNWRAT